MFWNDITKEQKPVSLNDTNIKELDDYDGHGLTAYQYIPKLLLPFTNLNSISNKISLRTNILRKKLKEKIKHKKMKEIKRNT
jgi:hypothetical protein